MDTWTATTKTQRLKSCRFFWGRSFARHSSLEETTAFFVVTLMMQDTRRYILRDFSIRDSCKTYLDTIAIDSDKPLEVIVRPYKKKRSLAQNNLLWMWLGLIANYLGDEHGIGTTSEDLKEEFQERFIGLKTYLKSDGTVGQRLRGTSELNTAEFTEFLNRIDVYCGSELGLRLPHPDDIWCEAMGRAA